MVKQSMRLKRNYKKQQQRRTVKKQRKQQRKQQQRKQQKQQQEGGMMGVINTALVPFGLLALQKHQQKKAGKKRTVKRNRKSKKN